MKTHMKDFLYKNKDTRKQKIKESLFVASIVTWPLLLFVVYWIGGNITNITLAFQKYDIEQRKFVFLSFNNLFDNFTRFFKEFSGTSGMGTLFTRSVFYWLITYAVYTYSEFFSVVLSSSDIWVNVSGVNIQNNTDLPDYADVYGNGVLFTATRSGGTVRYKNNIDLSESGLITPVLTAMFTPTTYGVKEFTSLQIRLIDAYDESNYVTVLISAVAYGYDYDSSVVCGANKNYEMVGLTTGGTITTSTTTATKIRSTMKGKYDGQYGCIRSLPFAIYFDAENNAIYAGPKANTTQLSLVADLDNSEHVGMGNEWYGFSTGEVKLEITFNGCLAGTANLTVLDVFGQSMSGEKFNDTESPYVILKNFDSANIPNAAVGKEYPIFEALLYDSADGLLGNVENVIAYYYENGKKKELIITDNKFIPTVSGTYYIEYFGFDNSGNTVVKTVEIQAKNTINQLSYVLDGQIENEFFVGETLFLPKGNVTGGSGSITVEKSLVCGGNTYIIEDENIVLEQAGEYTYIVNISDYLGQTYKFQKSFNVSYSAKPIVKEKLLPTSIIKNKEYTFPEFTAIRYSDNGSESIPVSIFVNGNELAIDRKYTALSAEPITVEYRADNWTKSFIVNVSDPSTEEVYLASWFDYNKEEISVSAESLDFIFSTDKDRTINGKTSFSFINALGTSNAKIEFNVVNNNFEKLNIYITDAANADVRIKLTVEKNAVIGETSVFRINDGYARTMAGSFYSGKTTKPFALYISGQNIYDYDNNLLDYISTTLNGDAFYGFSNDGVYIEFEFAGVVGESSIVLKQLWNHSFGDIDGDYISPIVSVDAFSVQPKKGDIVTIPHISAFDVLDSCVDVKLTVSNSYGTVKEYSSGQLLSSLSIDLSKEYTYYNEKSCNAGFIGKIESGAVVKNLIFSGSTGYKTDGSTVTSFRARVGIFAYENAGTIENCYIHGKMYSSWGNGNAGACMFGAIFINNGTIQNTVTEIMVKNNNTEAENNPRKFGFAVCDYGTIKNCVTVSSVSNAKTTGGNVLTSYDWMSATGGSERTVYSASQGHEKEFNGGYSANNVVYADAHRTNSYIFTSYENLISGNGYGYKTTSAYEDVTSQTAQEKLGSVWTFDAENKTIKLSNTVIYSEN